MGKRNRRRRSHSDVRRAQRFFGHRTRVWTWEADREHSGAVQNAYAKKHMGAFWRALGPDTVRAVLSYRQNWAICVRAVCWTGAGDWWVEDETFVIRDAALQDLEEFHLYEKARADVLSACQRRHVYDAGWLAETFLDRHPADDPRWPLAEISETEILTPERQALWREVDEDFRAEGEVA